MACWAAVSANSSNSRASETWKELVVCPRLISPMIYGVERWRGIPKLANDLSRVTSFSISAGRSAIRSSKLAVRLATRTLSSLESATCTGPIPLCSSVRIIAAFVTSSSDSSSDSNASIARCCMFWAYPKKFSEGRYSSQKSMPSCLFA